MGYNWAYGVTNPIMNARMYAVTPEVEAGWQALLRHITAEAGVTFDYVAHPAPQPLEQLWSRPDLGCVFMCGYPIALKLAPVIPIAAPIPSAPWAEGRPVYRSDLIVRQDSRYQSLEDTFNGCAGWTVEHSHSGFNAFRYHLLDYRTPQRPRLYREVRGHLVTARKILDSVLDGSIDIGPLDSYWHQLIAQHNPGLGVGIRVLASTQLAPIPAFVAASSLPHATIAQLRTTFAGAARKAWFEPYRQLLLLEGFAAVEPDDFATTLAWDHAARAANYPVPA
jgi:ABC-type phosphate/phosphonate transport system substrate-binding protein